MLELLVVIVTITILILFLLPVLSGIRARGERVKCMANLRSLYVATEAYLQQNGSWPQIDVDESDEEDQAYARSWIAALKPFGISEKSWICPTIQNLLRNPDLQKPENVRVDYYACPFDDKPMTPHQWPQQPWFVEAGDVHGNGNLIIFTDGSINDLKSVTPAH